MAEDLYTYLDPSKKQALPVYYPGEGQFLSQIGTPGEPSAAVGARARVEIPISNNPFVMTGIRVRNVYVIPEEFQTVDALTYLARLDGEQTIRTDLAEQNVFTNPTSQSLVMGAQGIAAGSIHWHPLEAPYPFQGGNNINMEFIRETSYPDEFATVLVKTVLVGWLLMSDAAPPASPPSSGAGM